MKKNFFLSIGAVAAGLIVVIILSNGTDMVLESLGIFPSVANQRVNGFNTPWMAALALFYRLLFLIVGGYLVAFLAPANPIRHVVILGGIGTALGILGAAGAWGFAPGWFLLTPVVLGIPCVWLGGQLRIKTESVS